MRISTSAKHEAAGHTLRRVLAQHGHRIPHDPGILHVHPADQSQLTPAVEDLILNSCQTARPMATPLEVMSTVD
jgi:hypothetical protein